MGWGRELREMGEGEGVEGRREKGRRAGGGTYHPLTAPKNPALLISQRESL